MELDSFCPAHKTCLEHQILFLVVILVLATNFCFGGKKEMGKMILEILEAEITYHCQRTGAESPLNKQREITL